MSKTTVFLIVVVIAAGLAIGIYTHFNPITTIQGFIENPATLMDSISTLPQTLLDNWKLFTGGIAGFAGSLTIFSKVYSKMKQSKEQVQGQLSQVSDVKASLENQLAEQKETFQNTISKQQTEFTDNIQTMSSKLVETQDKLDVKIQEVKNLTDERNYWANETKKAKALLENKTRVP